MTSQCAQPPRSARTHYNTTVYISHDNLAPLSVAISAVRYGTALLPRCRAVLWFSLLEINVPETLKGGFVTVQASSCLILRPPSRLPPSPARGRSGPRLRSGQHATNQHFVQIGDQKAVHFSIMAEEYPVCHVPWSFVIENMSLRTMRSALIRLLSWRLAYSMAHGNLCGNL